MKFLVSVVLMSFCMNFTSCSENSVKQKDTLKSVKAENNKTSEAKAELEKSKKPVCCQSNIPSRF